MVKEFKEFGYSVVHPFEMIEGSLKKSPENYNTGYCEPMYLKKHIICHTRMKYLVSSLLSFHYYFF